MSSYLRNMIKFLLSATFTLWVGIAFSQTTETVEQNSVHSYTVTGGNGWTYNWTLIDPNSNSVTLSSTESFDLSQTEDITFSILGDYTLRVQATDNLGCLSKILEKTIEVVEIANNPPIAVDDSFSTPEETVISGNLLTNDSDPDGDNISANAVTIANGNGTLQISSNGSFTFTPSAGFSGSISFSYDVCDDGDPQLCDEGQVTFDVIENGVPVAQNGTFSMDENTTLNSDLVSLVSDPENHNLTFTSQTQTTTNGSVTINEDGTFTYTPDADFNGNDFFIYEVCDDGTPSKCSQGNITITVREVLEFNRFAVNDIAFVFENSSTNGQVLNNDIDFSGTGISVSIPSGSDVVNGSLNMNSDGSFTYQPNTGFIGIDNFYYEVCASEEPAGCDEANVTIHVLPQEITTESVILNDDEVETSLNTSVTGNALANDFSPVDDNIQINTLPQQAPANGTLTINEDGTFEYTPETGFIGEDYFIYEACGQVTAECKTARVTIRVANELEPAIFAVDDVVHLFSNETASGDLLLNDIQPSGKTVTLNTTPVVSPSFGTVSISSNGNYTYNPTSTAYPFVDQFVYEICDQDSYCSRATVYIIVTEEPNETADVSVVKTGPAEIAPNEEITYEIVVSNSGSVTATNVTLDDFLPAAILSPEYQLDGAGDFASWPGQLNLGDIEDGSSIQVTIRGTVENGAPDLIENYASVSSDQYDPDLANNVSTVQTVTSRAPVIIVENGLHQIIGCCYDSGLQLDASNSIGLEPLTFLWEPSTNLDDATSSTPLFTGSESTTYTLTVTASNGESSTETVIVEVKPCPLINMASQVFANSPNEMIMLDASESTGHKLSYAWWPAGSELIVSGETTSNPVVSGVGKYYLQITDSLGCTAIDSVTVGLLVQITAVDDSTNMLVNTSVDINVVENDLPEGGVDPASITIVSPPEHGIAVVTADSIITYTPDQYYAGRDDFIYSVCDYFENCDDATVLVIINDEALFVPNAFTPNGDGYNDLFEIKGISEYQNVSLKIFNRWGNLVYEASNYGAAAGRTGFWDGIANRGLMSGGGQVPTGTYFYILDLGNGEEKINGFIYLDR